MQTRWVVPAVAALLIATCSLAGCSAGGGPQQATSGAASTSRVTLTARLDQFRDNYSRQIIELQISNIGPAALTIRAAAVSSESFTGRIEWVASPDGTEIPPGQTKSLPAQLPAPVCPGNNSAPRLEVTISGQHDPVVLPTEDPFGVLERNNMEMCLTQDVASVARLEFAPVLESGPGPGKAALRLLVLPQGSPGSFTIESFHSTPLLTEDPAAPWPMDIHVSGMEPDASFLLVVRPTRCDPHAVAEDKLGTVIPVDVSANGRRGTVKVAAGQALRGQLLDFVTTACSDGRLGP